ncbi:hypothetical protein CHS0354_028156 [Potamilus streckersoni]|uniref:Uncharacterized protein n=1 Tax=Potamilus streckersoni TaxID=2493646 RepID=A0AAE0WEL6_9BIVA|nr:hypothetical protein CHS0354_028156 [Potamilus streckersoni]
MTAKQVHVLDRSNRMKGQVYSVQHRSDILLEEQIHAVRQSQDALRKSLTELENAKTLEDVNKYRMEVQELKEKSEKAITVFQALHKINTELQFAREELDYALDHSSGDVNEARKRVMWLEDRMGVLCGKIRVRGQPLQRQRGRSYRSSDQETSTFRSRRDSGSASSDDFDRERGAGVGQGDGQRKGNNMSLEFLPDMSIQRKVFSPSETGSDYDTMPQTHPSMMETPSTESETPYMVASESKMFGPGMRKTDESEFDTSQMYLMTSFPSVGSAGLSQTQPMPQTPRVASEASESAKGSLQTHEATSDIGTTQAVYVHGRAESDEEEKEIDTGRKEMVIHIGQTREEMEDEERKEEEERETGKEIEETEDSENNETEDRGEEEVDDAEVNGIVGLEKVVSADGRESQEGVQESQLVQLMAANTGITVKLSSDPSLRKSVILISPKRSRENTRQAFLREIDDDEEDDEARNYWFSEHHQFEHSEFAEVLCELDPLSYHQMGLAVPGTFLQKSEKKFDDLPWRPKRKGSDIQDIHKIALDKLALRLHTMSGKVFDAAMLSVKATSTEAEKHHHPGVFTSMEVASKDTITPFITSTDGRPGMVTAPVSTADASSRSHTMSTVVMPPLPSRRHGSSKSGRLVYYPKPIPPPEVLPLTRTSKDKEFPQLIEKFVDVKERKPAHRIVDQHNLQNETKLTLFKETARPTEDGPNSNEWKFRMMLERERSGSKSERSMKSGSHKSFDKGAKPSRLSVAKTVIKENENDEVNTWGKIKPSSKGKEYPGLKWERVKNMVHVNLVSNQPVERIDAAKHLGLLRCGDAMVFYALKERLKNDEEPRVCYEATKSLILLGCWEEEVLQMIIKYLIIGNTEIRQDLIKTMTDGRNVQYVNKKIPSFPELVKVLSHFCRNPDPDDMTAFDAAVLLGRLCVSDENAKFKLLRALDQSQDTHVKAKALEILVKQLTATSPEIVHHLLDLFRESPVWKYRALAADLLIVLGRKHVCIGNQEEKVYLLLEKKLWDDPSKDVRVAAAKALTALGMFSKACERIEKKLEDPDEDVRAEAVISVGTLEMKNEKIIRLLLEMLELDSSDYVRLMIARTFTVLKMTDKRIVRALRERDKVEGALARESRKALKILESLMGAATPHGRKSMMSTPHGQSPVKQYTPTVTT